MKENGFTLIELIIVIAIISVLLAMAVGINNNFAARRTIDGITYKISSNLTTTKLQAVRSGVEFETDLIFDSSSKRLSLVTFRGRSNRGSRRTNGDFTEVNRQIFNISENYEFVTKTGTGSSATFDPLTNHTFHFNPNSTLGGARTIIIRPNGNTQIEKCGRIVLSTLGRIRTATGNWDGNRNRCNPSGAIQN